MNKKPYILCAAIWYKDQPTSKLLPPNITKGIVIAGQRHPHCIYTFIALTGKRSVEPECGKYIQGFITNEGNFVDRVLGGKIAYEAKQTKKLLPYLFSEDLY